MSRTNFVLALGQLSTSCWHKVSAGLLFIAVRLQLDQVMSSGVKTMDTRRIIAHVWMYILIMLGVVSAFLFIPSVILFSQQNRYYLRLASIPFLIFASYNFASAFYYRLKEHFESDHLEKIDRKSVV